MEGHERLVKELTEELHALSQPVSTLRCRLDIAVMLDDEASAKDATRGGLEDVDLIFASISRLRQRLDEEVARGRTLAEG
jgi:hydrogenase maturation factor